MDIKITIEGYEKTIKLLDKANSLMRELQQVVNELRPYTHVFPEITREDGESVT